MLILVMGIYYQIEPSSQNDCLDLLIILNMNELDLELHGQTYLNLWMIY